MRNNILKQIKKCRLEKSITLKELSTETGISMSYLWHLENDKKNNPSLDVLEKIANALDGCVTFLFIKN